MKLLKTWRIFCCNNNNRLNQVKCAFTLPLLPAAAGLPPADTVAVATCAVASPRAFSAAWMVRQTTWTMVDVCR